LDTELLSTVSGRYGQLAFFANDTGALGRSLHLYGEWAQNELGFIRQFIEPGSVVLDVGAYVGTHTLAFAHFVGEDGRVIAFEPMPESFDVLKGNVSANQLSNVRLEKVAVAERAGSIEISTLDIDQAASFGSTSLKGRYVHGSACSEQEEAVQTKAPVEVPTVAIDGFGFEKCSLIKIDAEGMESAVLKGAAETIGRLGPVVYAECNCVDEGLKSLRLFKELGYEVRLHVVDAFNPDNFFGVKENIFDRAREAALVGVPSHKIEGLDTLVIRPCELLVRVDTADDLVLGLLNKPQYTEEILRPSVAAIDGAAAWLEEFTALRLTRERLENEVTCAKGVIAEERTRTAQAMHSLAETERELGLYRSRTEKATESLAEAERQLELYRSRTEKATESLAEAERQLELYRTEVENKAALFEAAMRQARSAREIADAASSAAAQAEREKAESEREKAEAERVKAEAVRGQAELQTKLDATLQERMQCERQLSAVYASISWRLTAPVRAAVNWLRRVLFGNRPCNRGLS
jgi:FkbM family methyltransferase